MSVPTVAGRQKPDGDLHADCNKLPGWQFSYAVVVGQVLCRLMAIGRSADNDWQVRALLHSGGTVLGKDAWTRYAALLASLMPPRRAALAG